MHTKLLVIARHRPSVLLAKGEYTPRYYNPEDLFDEVHLLLSNRDQPSIEDLQFAAGDANLFVHNLPRPSFKTTLGWRPWLIGGWIKQGIALVKSISPNLIRVHNNYLEGFLAKSLSEELKIPYLVSIHHSDWQFKNSLGEKILSKLLARYERESLQFADSSIAVYQSNLEYATNMNGGDPRLIYNVVSSEIPIKKDYSLSDPPKIITINQQQKLKNPSNILRAIVDIDCEYWLVGNGPDHQQLLDLVDELGLSDKVTISTGIPNDQLTAMLPDFDLHISHCDVWGMSKTVVEASLAGLPTLINFHPLRPVPEYRDDWIFRCENSPEAYREKIIEVLTKQSARKSIGKRALDNAKKSFNPVKMEKKLASLYSEKMISG